MEQFVNWFYRNMGSESSSLEWYWRLAIVLGVILSAYLVDLIFSYLLVPAVRKLTQRTATKVDDILLNDHVCKSFSNIIPPVILTGALPFVTQGTLEMILARLTVVYIIVCVTRFLCVLLGSAFDAYAHVREGKGRALKGLVQTFQIVISAVSVILAISTLIDKSPAYILSGLGAMAAVMMLIFQDSIKGLVAGIQLSFNDMLRLNDWISIPARNVDGVVTEITLTTVKVRNWDNTIMTIPPYNLLTETFQNWRGMQEAEGRRLCRHVNVDLHTVRFVTDKDVAAWSKQGMDVGGVRLGETTNLEVFRTQLLDYLRHHPDINENMTLMVRQLAAGSEGIPVQIYAFTHTKEWEAHEEIQSRLIEYTVSLLREFGLRAYQRGSDFRHSV